MVLEYLEAPSLGVREDGGDGAFEHMDLNGMGRETEVQGKEGPLQKSWGALEAEQGPETRGRASFPISVGDDGQMGIVGREWAL